MAVDQQESAGLRPIIEPHGYNIEFPDAESAFKNIGKWFRHFVLHLLAQ